MEILYYCPLEFDPKRLAGEGAWVPVILSRYRGRFTTVPKTIHRTGQPYCVGRGDVDGAVWGDIQNDPDIYAVLDTPAERNRKNRPPPERTKRDSVLGKCGHAADLQATDSVQEEMDKLAADCGEARGIDGLPPQARTETRTR